MDPPSVCHGRTRFRPSTSYFEFCHERRGYPATKPGMTRQVISLLQRLQRIVFRLRPSGACARIVVQRQRGLAECLAVDLDDGLAELAEFVGELELGGANLVGRLGARLH